MCIIKRFKDTVDIMKTDLIADKTKLIRTQEQLLESQRDQLWQLKSAVESSTVQEIVQKEIKSYSEAIGSQKSQIGSVQVQETVKKQNWSNAIWKLVQLLSADQM